MSKRVLRTSRRGFLGGAAAAITAPYFIPATVLGKDGATAASERITLGMIGVGKMGQGHCNAMGGHKEMQILAICDVDKMSRDQAHAKVVESHKARNKPTDIALYNDYREVLARKDIDAVLIATPDHWHALPVIEACKAGKDIYCEKPMSLTVREAWQMHDAVRKHNVVFQTGSQQRSDARFRHACQLVRNGYIGELKTVHANVGGPSKWCDLPEEPVPAGLDWDRWLGQAPVRPFNKVLRPPHNDSFPNWRGYREYSGGMMTDWGAHHFDIGQWGIGADGSGPVQVIAKTDKEPLTYVYACGAKMLHAGQAGDQKVDGVLFTGTEGWVMVNRGRLSASSEALANYKTFAWKDSDTKLYASSSHHQDWIDAMRKRTRPICDVEIGASSVSTCHLGNISYWTGQSFKYDPKTRQITDNPECAKLLDREQRSPYTVPAV